MQKKEKWSGYAGETTSAQAASTMSKQYTTHNITYTRTTYINAQRLNHPVDHTLTQHASFLLTSLVLRPGAFRGAFRKESRGLGTRLEVHRYTNYYL